MITRTQLINRLIFTRNFKTYLEIGVGDGQNINRINIGRKNIIGIDPNPECISATHCMTSDEFFSKNRNTFDIIFIDGLHTYQQVNKDIVNSLSCLNAEGVIVLHDCNPELLGNAGEEPSPLHFTWNGTVWKSIVEARCTNSNIFVSVVDIDFGCGIITNGSQTLYTDAPLETCLEWEYFDKNRKNLLNLISTDDFERIYVTDESIFKLHS